jgi:hypothetical protein
MHRFCDGETAQRPLVAKRAPAFETAKRGPRRSRSAGERDDEQAELRNAHLILCALSTASMAIGSSQIRAASRNRNRNVVFSGSSLPSDELVALLIVPADVYACGDKFF